MTHNLIFCPVKRMQWDKGCIQGFQMSEWQNHLLVPKARASISAVEILWALAPALRHGSLERKTSSIWGDTFCYTRSLCDNCTTAVWCVPLSLLSKELKNVFSAILWLVRHFRSVPFWRLTSHQLGAWPFNLHDTWIPAGFLILQIRFIAVSVTLHCNEVRCIQTVFPVVLSLIFSYFSENIVKLHTQNSSF